MTVYGELNPVAARMIRKHRMATKRCGICDGEIDTGERTKLVDDEKCHEECAKTGARVEELQA